MSQVTSLKKTVFNLEHLHNLTVAKCTALFFVYKNIFHKNNDAEICVILRKFYE